MLRSTIVPRFVLLALATLGAACSAEPPPIAVLAGEAEIDSSVTALVAQHVASARQAPADAERRATLAMVYEANELWHEADQAWAHALVLEPDRPLWRLHRAIAARQAGHDELALDLLRDVVAEAPELGAARFRLGEGLLEIGDVAGARRELEAARRLVPQSPEPLIGLAEIAGREDRHGEAVELCRAALALTPDVRRAHYVMGLSLRALGRAEEAQEALQRGLDANRGSVGDPLTERIAGLRRGYTVRITQASSLEAAGRPEEARRILEGVVREHPRDVTALNNLAAVMVQLGDAQAALGLLDRAREIDPDQFATYINRAAAEMNLGLPEDAISSATRAIELSRSVGRPYFVRAQAYVALGRHLEAYEDLVRVTELDARDWISFAVAGDVALELGRPVDAARHYEAALQRKSDHLPARTRLALAYDRSGRRQDALRAYEDARRLAPNHPDVATLARRLGIEPR